MRRVVWVVLMAAACGFCRSARGEVEIVSFHDNGRLTCANLPTGSTSVVEWAPALSGPWSGNWNGLEAVVADSNGVIEVAVPMFYRVRLIEYLVVDLSAGPTATNYPVSLLYDLPSGEWPDEYKTTKMLFARIPAGTFIMGAPAGELGSLDGDETQHEVTLTQDFYLGVFEVTQKQWERVMGTWPSYFTNTVFRDARPVEKVSYSMIRGATAGAGWPENNNVDADSFMGRLRARTGRAFDLPTESQWEYAGRAGTVTALNSGKDLTDRFECPNLAEVARYWYNGGSGYTPYGSTAVGTAKAGSYQPSAWDLYDIHGNVWEWCLDWYAATYPGTVTDPVGAGVGTQRVMRGGSWGSLRADYSRSASRERSNPGLGNELFGFRVALPVVQP